MKTQTETAAGPAAETPTAILMIGGPGAGKSYVRKRDFGDYKVLDCDAFKAEHPDYDPKNPAALHDWSKKQLVRAFYSAVGAGESFVLDGTGTSIERYVSYINHLHQAGYEVELVFVKTSLRTALERNRNRERVVPEDVVREKHALVGLSLEILSGYADAVRIVNND